MDSEKFLQARKKLGKTQKQLGELFATPLKGVHGYELGWRSVPANVEGQLFSGFQGKGEIRMKERFVGLLKEALPRGEGNALHGSSRPERFVGSSTAPFVVVSSIRDGMKR